MKLVWCFLVVISAIRGILMLVELQRGYVDFDYFLLSLPASDADASRCSSPEPLADVWLIQKRQDPLGM